MAMFDPFYVSSVLEDILSRELGVQIKFTLTKIETPQECGERNTKNNSAAEVDRNDHTAHAGDSAQAGSFKWAPNAGEQKQTPLSEP